MWNSEWKLVAAALPLNHLQEVPPGNLVKKKKASVQKPKLIVLKFKQHKKGMKSHCTLLAGWLAGWHM